MRQKTTLGEVLVEEFIKPYDITPEELSTKLGCDIDTLPRNFGLTYRKINNPA